MWWIWMACAAEEVELVGRVFDGDADDAPTLPGATVTSRDEVGVLLGTDETGHEGRFRVPAPLGDIVFLEVEADGHRRSSFMGITGLAAVMQVEAHTVYALPDDRWDAFAADFAGCPGLDGGGSSVLGEVRMSDLTDPVTGEHPLVSLAAVSVLDLAGNTVATACYLDDLGRAYDPDAERTGDTGRFAVYGLEPGPFQILVTYTWGDLYDVPQFYPLWVPKDGVAPRLPLWTAFDP